MPWGVYRLVSVVPACPYRVLLTRIFRSSWSERGKHDAELAAITAHLVVLAGLDDTDFERANLGQSV